MRRSHRLVALSALILAASACEPTVIIERDETVSIAPGARWAWSAPDADGPRPAQGALQPPATVHDLIAGAVAQGLEARGFRMTTADSADVFVHFHVARREVVDTMPPLDAPRAVGDQAPQDWGRYGHPEQMRDRTMTWQEGLLVVDALTADGRHVAWRGIVYGEVKSVGPADQAQAVRAAIERLLARFP